MFQNELTLTAPAVLFSCSSLITLAYTNRFMGIANLIRNLVKQYQQTREEHIKSEIENLHTRIYQIRDMQIAGILSILFAVLAILVLCFRLTRFGEMLFLASLISLTWSLYLSIAEIWISTTALNIELCRIKDDDV